MPKIFRFPHFEAIVLIAQICCTYFAFFVIHRDVASIFIGVSIVSTITCFLYRAALKITGLRNTILAVVPGIVNTAVGVYLWITIQYGISTP